MASISAALNKKVVSHEEWLAARKAFLQKEKELTHLRDQVSRQRLELPWEKVEKNYVFDGPNGKQSLAELFAGRSQLLVYHFMLGPDWVEGCPSCSSSEITLTACCRTSVRATSPSPQSPAPQCRRSPLSRSEWAGSSIGSLPTRTASTSITKSPSRQKRSQRVRRTTTSERFRFPSKNAQAPAPSIRMKRATSITPTQRTRADLTFSSARTTSSTSLPKVAMKTASPSPWRGLSTTINTQVKTSWTPSAATRLPANRTSVARKTLSPKEPPAPTKTGRSFSRPVSSSVSIRNFGFQ